MAEFGTVEESQEESGTIATYVIISVSGAGILLGLACLLLAIIKAAPSTSSYGLRGRFLSNRFCASCPVCRDCLQNCGARLDIQCLQLAAKDSLECYDMDEELTAYRYHTLRETRRVKPTILGVRPSIVIQNSAPSGFKWKKKWRDRRMRSKVKRKKKNEERKLKKQAAQVLASDSSDATLVKTVGEAVNTVTPDNGESTTPSLTVPRVDKKRTSLTQQFLDHFRRRSHTPVSSQDLKLSGSSVSQPSENSSEKQGSPGSSKTQMSAQSTRERGPNSTLSVLTGVPDSLSFQVSSTSATHMSTLSPLQE